MVKANKRKYHKNFDEAWEEARIAWGAKPVKLNFDSKDKPHPNVSSPNPKHKPFSVTNDEGNTFQIRFLSSGSKWGRGNVLTHGKDKQWSYEKQGYAVPEKYSGDVIEFYDTKNTDDKSKWVLVSSYRVETLLSDDRLSDQGINLYGGVDKWKMDAKSMKSIIGHLKNNKDEFDLGDK